ncbi:hypothetical protein J6590_108057, partial [Homalodisca vitripennis]
KHLQLNLNEPTRIAERSETCIDHVYVKLACKDKTMISAAVEHAHITDHSLTAVWGWVEGGRPSSPGPRTADSTSKQYRINYKYLNDVLDQTDWAQVYGTENASDAFDKFYDLLQVAISASK